jgi:hypothetical protein
LTEALCEREEYEKYYDCGRRREGGTIQLGDDFFSASNVRVLQSCDWARNAHLALGRLRDGLKLKLL